MQATNIFFIISILYGVIAGIAIGISLATLIWNRVANQWKNLFINNDEFYQQQSKEYQEIIKEMAQSKTSNQRE
jgi:hypothetical protein